MRTKVIIASTIVLLVFVLEFQDEALAIPAFARKYQISCQVCHSPAPNLKPFGNEFADNGFRLTEYESPRYFIETGDDKLSLLRDLPVAIRLDGIATYNFGQNKTVDFATLSGVKLLSGGELSKKLSYYMYFFMSEGGEIVGIEDAFLTYNDLFGTGLNISAGQFQLCDPFYKRELRLTVEDLAILKAVPGQSTASLTYDRGLMFNYAVPGINTGIVAEISNGNGLSMGGEEFIFDKDSYKNILGYASQPLGKAVIIGFIGYFGKERMFSGTEYYTSNINMFGPVLKLDFSQLLMINTQYIRRTDSQVYDSDAAAVSNDNITQGGYLEAIFAPKGDMSKFYLTGLLNFVESDYSPLDYKSATLNFSYVLRRNVRLLTEYTYLDSEEGKYGKLSCGFVAAF
ncbi:hypothetical protein ACFLTA_07380 [Bacteroidota bacterium]